MRFIIEDRALETDDGELIKEFDCPPEKRWDDLLSCTDQSKTLCCCNVQSVHTFLR